MLRLRDLQEKVDDLTLTETKQGVNFSSGGGRIRDTTHCMKAASDKTHAFSSFTPFFSASFLDYR